jgi:2-hydroxyglutarate dehydrogenase
VAIVGGGIVGLAVARELSIRRPGRSVCVLEREAGLAGHQTGHSSGVIHSGIYYEPGSLKATLCTQGAREMFEFCEARGIPVRRCGKVILATERRELGQLQELHRRGRANGVQGLAILDSEEIEGVEPHARGIAALHSPNTGVADFPAVAHAMARELRDAGNAVATRCEVERIEDSPRALRLHHSRGATEARAAVFCAGAWADRLAVAAGADPDPRIVPFRGAYLRLRPERAHLVRALIYPVPDPAVPFLGVHLTRGVNDEVLVGPTALIAPARDAYRLSALRARDARETLTWPGTWRMLARWWRTGITELRLAASRTEFARAAARYVPELVPGDVEPAFAGLRAQALARNGRLVEDFVFSRSQRTLHVRNAPSPGATSAFAIARHVAEEAERML